MADKNELVELLDRCVFNPILHASAEGRKERDREELEDVQRRTRTEQGRYRSYPSAEKVMEMYKDDLNSEKARTVNAKLRRLGLPTLPHVKDELERLAS